MAIAASPVVKVLAFLPMGLAVLHLLASQRDAPALGVVSSFTVLALVPAWLVEQRYYMIPFALVLLLRPDQGRRVEAVTSAYYVVVSLIFTYGIQHGYFFL